MNNDQPEWAARLERKVDALLMALRQMGYAQEMDGDMVNEIFASGPRLIKHAHPMRWNRGQAQKVITQGLAGHKPEYDR